LDLEQVPWTPEENAEIAARHFNNPDHPDTVFANTILKIKSDRFDGYQYVSDIAIDQVNGTFVVMYADPETGEVATRPLKDLPFLELYGLSTGEEATIRTSIGPVKPIQDSVSQAFDGFEGHTADEQPFRFGEVSRSGLPDNIGTRLHAYYENGKWILRKASQYPPTPTTAPTPTPQTAPPTPESSGSTIPPTPISTQPPVLTSVGTP
jgi:hypothetical protein